MGVGERGEGMGEGGQKRVRGEARGRDILRELLSIALNGHALICSPFAFSPRPPCPQPFSPAPPLVSFIMGVSADVMLVDCWAFKGMPHH